MTEAQAMQLLVSALLAAALVWLGLELWLRRAPISEAVVEELAVKRSGEGDTWYRSRVTLHVDYSPEKHWVWISRKQHEGLTIGDVLPVHVRTVRGKRRLRAVGHRRRLWWIGAAVVFFLINLINLGFGD